MGSDRSSNPEEKPVHQVRVNSFYFGQFEVTRQQWNGVAALPQINRPLRLQFIGTIAGFEFGEITPADEVRWEEAIEFCERLSRRTGRIYRLPSEAEWEYACRAGTQTEYSWGDQVNYNLASLRNVSNGAPPSIILPAGMKGYANQWGFFDLHGNVAEWCLDTKHPNYIGAPADGSAWIQGGDSAFRVLRGGYYSQRPEYARSASRDFQPVGLRASFYGLRVVLQTDPQVPNLRGILTTSAASYLTASLPTESIAALFGANLSTSTQAASTLPLPTLLAGASVFLRDLRGNEHLASLFFVSPGQINFLMPPNLPPGPATVYAVHNGNIHSSGTLEIAQVSPGLFSADASGRGLATAVALRVSSNGAQVYEPVVRFDATQNRFIAQPLDLSNPNEQVFLLLFGTGFRQRGSLANVAAQLGGTAVEVLFAGAQGELAGLDQCNLRLPASLAGRGEVSITLTADGRTSNAVSVQVR